MSSVSPDRLEIDGLSIASTLADFVAVEAAPAVGVDPEAFWSGLATIVRDLLPRHDELLRHRDGLQERIDDWHRTHPGPIDTAAYRGFLEANGYLREEPADVSVELSAVDPDLAIAAPQLVVPADNARYALNAANARWGSLYDALYGTDAIAEDEGAERTAHYNQIRGRRVIAYGRSLLDDGFALTEGSHVNALKYRVDESGLIVELLSGGPARLADPERFVGHTGPAVAPSSVILERHGLHVRVMIDPDDAIGADDLAGVADIHLEAAATTIVDLEDSVAAVDVEDKLVGYRNWLGLMRGDLRAAFEKDGRIIDRRLEPDIDYIDRSGRTATLRRTSLLFVRNTGMHLETDSVLIDGRPLPETMLDAAITILCAKHDLLAPRRRNSPAGSVYIVKPKMHGPDEVALADELFGRIESLLDLHPYTVKMGIMDEERRTSVNLLACMLR